jgi:hypothetical protein
MVAPVQEWPDSVDTLLHPTAPSHLDLNQLSPEGRDRVAKSRTRYPDARIKACLARH